MDATMQRRLALIVDGYNVIRNNARYQVDGQDDWSSEDAWNKARQTLINDAALLAKESYERCTVVFDGAGNAASTGQARKVAGIDVVFSPVGKSADTVIERLAHEAREAGLEVVVVSSDYTIQTTVFGGGVTRMSALGFGTASEAGEQEWHEEAREAAAGKRTLGSRIGGEAVAKLQQMLREKSS